MSAAAYAVQVVVLSTILIATLVTVTGIALFGWGNTYDD